MSEIDEAARDLERRGLRLSINVTIFEGQDRTSYGAYARKSNGKPGDGPRGWGKTPTLAVRSMMFNDLHKEALDELDSALGRLVSSYGRRSDAV